MTGFHGPDCHCDEIEAMLALVDEINAIEVELAATAEFLSALRGLPA